MRASVVISALIAVLVGFGGSVAIVISAAEAVGATQDQTSSWIAVLCVSMMATTAVLSIWHRMPIVTAWSTPGAALIATTSGLSIEAAAGAFLFSGGLLVLTAAFKPLNELVQRIPAGVAAAILAGVLFSFVLGLVYEVAALPVIGVPMIAVFLLVRLASPVWAVLAVLGSGLVLTYALGLATTLPPFALSRFVIVTPAFDAVTVIGVGLPLYLVTMASQNLPGFSVLRAAGYAPPSQSIIGVTGIASVLSAGFGAHSTSLAAITASICTGADAHPDKDKRWLGGPVYAAGYAVLATFGAFMVGVIASVPGELVAIVAGAALLGPFVGSAQMAFASDSDPMPAAAAFVITASGFAGFGIGAAFWGLVVGIGLDGLNRLKSGG
jgi:benzoate membrane transport protein